MNEQILTLPEKKSPPSQVDPGMLVIYGQSKVGKTDVLTQLPDCLIIDTEGGTRAYDAMKLEVSNLKELYEVMKLLNSNKGKYKMIAFDTLDNICNWYEAAIAAQYKVSNIGDIPYGAGYGVHREKVINFLHNARKLSPRIIITGHRKKAIIGDTTIEVSTTSLDLMGKLKNIVSAEADSIGYLYRKKGELWISFETSEELEVGSRQKHLSGRSFKFSWDEIYKD